MTDGCGLSNEMCHELLLKKEQGNAVLAFLFTVNNCFTSCTLLTKTECFSFKSGCDVGVLKLIKRRLAYSVIVGIHTIYL